MANRVLHCDMMVASSSAGRCVTKPRWTPCFRPSRAIRDRARRVGVKPTERSAEAKRCASSHTNSSGSRPRSRCRTRTPAGQDADDGVHHLARQAGELHDRHRPPIRIEANRCARISPIMSPPTLAFVEHEAVPRIVPDRLDPRDQTVIVHPGDAILQPAHPLVDEGNQVLEHVGHGRVDRVAAGLAECPASRSAGRSPPCTGRTCSSRAG